MLHILLCFQQNYYFKCILDVYNVYKNTIEACEMQEFLTEGNGDHLECNFFHFFKGSFNLEEDGDGG